MPCYPLQRAQRHAQDVASFKAELGLRALTVRGPAIGKAGGPRAAGPLGAPRAGAEGGARAPAPTASASAASAGVEEEERAALAGAGPAPGLAAAAAAADEPPSAGPAIPAVPAAPAAPAAADGSAMQRALLSLDLLVPSEPPEGGRAQAGGAVEGGSGGVGVPPGQGRA